MRHSVWTFSGHAKSRAFAISHELIRRTTGSMLSSIEFSITSRNDRLSRLPVCEQIVDFVVVLANTAAGVRPRYEGRDYSQRQVVFDVCVHAGERKLNR